MKRKQFKSKKYPIEKLNEYLKDNNQTIRIVKLQTGLLEFSNGFVLNNVDEIEKCRVRIRGKNSGKIIDLFYSTHEKDREHALVVLSEMKKLSSIQGGYTCYQKYGISRISDWMAKNEHPRKGVKQEHSWNRGKTKLDNDILAKMSKDRCGDGNPMFGKKHSPETKKNASEHIKSLILNNKFTPNSQNRLSFKSIVFDDCVFRSSWEVLYKSLYPNSEYEKLRVPYTHDGKDKVYIVDFIDYVNKIVTEIKPQRMFDVCDKTKAKVIGLQKWCKENDFHLRLFTEADIYNEKHNINYDVLDEKTKAKILKVIKAYETIKKN